VPEPILYDYQEEHLGAVRIARRQHQNVVFVAPTGYGKTHCFLFMTYRAYHRGHVVHIQSHLREILEQVSKRLSRFSIPHDWIASGKPDGDHTVKLCMVQTAARRMEGLRPPHLRIEDECHHARASQWQLLRNWSPLTKNLGCTATPQRPDGKGLDLSYGCMVPSMQIKELIEINQKDPSRGLVQPVVFAPPNELDLSDVGSSDGEYNLTKAGLALDKAKITGEAVAEYSRLCPGARAIVFDATIKRAKETAERFTAAGYKASHIDGNMDEWQRRAIFQGFENGSIQVLTSVNMFLEGVDVPGVEAVIWLRPTKSLVIWCQGNGRGMRAAPGKRLVYILDHVGNTYRHGLPDMDREWYLQGRPKGKKRENLGERLIRCLFCHAQFEPGPSACPQCFTPVPVKERKIIQVAGQLVLAVDEERITKLMQREQIKQKIADSLYKCHSEKDCIALALELGKNEEFGRHLWIKKNIWRKGSGKSIDLKQR